MKKTKDRAQIAYTGEIPRTPMRFLWHLTRRRKGIALLAVLVTIVAQTLEVVGYYLISRLVDGFTLAEGVDAQLDVLLFWGLAFFLSFSAGRILWRASGFAGIKWIVEVQAEGYSKLYAYLTKHSHTYFSDRFAGSLSNKVSNAVEGGTRLLERMLWGVGPEIVSLVATIYLFVAIHWTIALGVFLNFGVVFAVNVFLAKKRRPHVVAYSLASSKLRGEAVDLVTNISAVRQYVRGGDELHRLDGTIDDRAQKDKKQSYMGEWIMVMNTAMSIVLTLSVLLVVYFLLRSGQATAGSLVLVLILLSRMGHFFTIIGNMINAFVRIYGEAEEGLDAILIDHEIADATNAKKLKVRQGEITFNNVSFEYGSVGVFKNFSLVIKPGERIGLVGSSGAGKTTFVSLLLRQHDIQFGEILIDGQNIFDITQDSLRRAIAVVPQEPLLFHRSILENIGYGKPNATSKEIEAAARKAQAHEFISKLPDGYKTLVGERGVKLSGGQRQRVAIARAMLKDAPILVLDEATSSLDSKSEVAIQKALHKLMEGKTVIAVAHRLSTLREMDRIIVLNGGRVVEDGSHEELLKIKGIYANLWNHQAGGFLLD